MYTDYFQLIVQEDGDGGDTAGREANYWFQKALSYNLNPFLLPPSQSDYKRVINLLQIQPGIWVRHPKQYPDPNDFSRDQTIPWILAMGEMKDDYHLNLLFKNQVKNWFRYQNGDIGLFEDLGYYIRAFRIWQACPLLLLGDAQMMINTLIRVFKSRDLNDVSDDVNHTLAQLQAQYILPTPISWLSRKIYKWFVKGGIQSRWDWYFRSETGANPFNEIYKPLIEKM